MRLAKANKRGIWLTLDGKESHFRTRETECKCGCGLNKVSQKFIDALEDFRNEINLPIKITSGCRCEKRNKEVGGSINSAHLPPAIGADIIVPSVTLKELFSMATIFFPGVGYYNDHIHIDIRERIYSKKYWVQTEKGKIYIDNYTIKDFIEKYIG